MNKTDNSLTDKLKMTSKQSEAINSFKEKAAKKVANTKFIINQEALGNINTLQTKKSFYNSALQIFITTHFGENNHFGNMTNNFDKVISFLELDSILDFKLKVPSFSAKSLNINTSGTTTFNDFDASSIFECTFYAKENIDSETFLNAISTFEDGFITKYNALAKEEIVTKKKELSLKKKQAQKKEALIYGAIGIVLVVAVFIYLKYLK